MLERRGIVDFLACARCAGALELHLLEPTPIGRLSGHGEVRLSPAERDSIIALQHLLLAFVAHRDRSPREPLELFGEIVAEDPTVLQKTVAFDFPADLDHGPRSSATRMPGGPQLLKSGLGTAYYDALDPARRPALETEFLRRLAARHPSGAIAVVHDYISVIAQR